MIAAMTLPAGPYRIILADPPWLYDDARTHASAGMALSAYRCLSVEELCALPVGALAADDCALCLWATRPKIREALAVMAGWGFAYCTELLTWVKARPGWAGWPLGESDVCAGLGHYTRANTEAVLLGRRGRLTVRDRTVRQVVVAPRGRHSAKPPEVRRLIVRLFGDVPRIELFARDRAPGWDAWGVEAGPSA